MFANYSLELSQSELRAISHGEVEYVVPMHRAASGMMGCVTRADLDCPTLGQPY